MKPTSFILRGCDFFSVTFLKHVGLFSARGLFSFALFLALVFGTSSLSASKKDSLDEVEAFLYQKRHEAVIESLEKYLQGNPGDAKASLLYSEALGHKMEAELLVIKADKLAKQYRFAQALDVLDEAELISPYLEKIDLKRKEILKMQKRLEPYANLSSAERDLVFSLIEEGKGQLSEGKNEEAINTFAKVIEIAPKSPEGNEGYNTALQRYNADEAGSRLKDIFAEVDKLEREGRIVEALARYEEILKLDPGNKKALAKRYELKERAKKMREEASRKELADEYYRSAQNFRTQRKYDEGIEQLKLGKELAPGLKEWDKLLADFEAEQKEYERREFEKDMEELSRQYNRGLLMLATEKYRESIISFQASLLIAKKYDDAVLIKQSKDLLETAKENMEQLEAEVVSPDSPYYDFVETLKQQGFAAYQREDYEQARLYFSEIRKIFPKNRIANRYYLAANIQMNPETKTEIVGNLVQQAVSLQQKNPLEARSVINLAYELDPKNEEIIELRKKIIEGNRPVTTATTVPQEQLDAWYREAFSIYQSNPGQATALAQKILAADPQYVKARTLLARIQGRSNVSRQNRPEIPVSARRAYSNGIVQYNNGNLEAAVASFQQALRIAPNYPQAQAALNRTRQYMNSRQ